MCFGYQNVSTANPFYADVFYSDYPNANVLNALTRNPNPTETGVNVTNIGYNSYNIYEIKRNYSTNTVYTVNGNVVATISTNVPYVGLHLNFFAQEQDISCD